jgi:hypothetical protein
MPPLLSFNPPKTAVPCRQWRWPRCGWWSQTVTTSRGRHSWRPVSGQTRSKLPAVGQTPRGQTTHRPPAGTWRTPMLMPRGAWSRAAAARGGAGAVGCCARRVQTPAAVAATSRGAGAKPPPAAPTAKPPKPPGFFDAQKAGVAASQLPASAAAAYPWLVAPMQPGDSVPGGYFVTGSDYVKVGDAAL